MKMKIKRLIKRIFPAAIAVAVLAALFCMPVSAASSEWFSASYSFQTLYGTDTSAEIYNDDDYYVDVAPYAWYGSSGVSYSVPDSLPVGKWKLQIPLNNVNIQLEAGEVLRFSALYEGVIPIELGNNPVVRIGFIEKISNSNDLLTSVGVTPSWNATMGRWTYVINHEWQATRDCNINRISIIVTVNNRPSSGSGTGGLTRFYLKQMEFGYGNPNSPEAPSYSSPDGGFIDDYTSKEEEVLNSTQEGQDEFNALFGNFSSVMAKFGPGMLAATWVFNILLDSFSLGYWLVYFSLTIGACAFIFGIAAWVGRGTRDNSAKSSGSRGKKGG